MIIDRIEIESYAAIKNLTLELSEGINLIEGSNESGKSSIAGFIKFVLYGVSGKGRDGHLSERKRAINYNESHAGGSLVVRVGGHRYKITRNTAVSGTVRESVRTKFSVRDMDTGAEISDGREPGEQLLGISESVFLRSAYLTQGGESELDGADVHSAITNILFSGDERLSVEKAAERIDNARIPLMHKHGGKGRIVELREEISDCSEKLRAAVEANREILALSSVIEEKKKTNAEQIEKYEALKRQKRAYECAKSLESINQLSRAEEDKVSTEMAMLEFKGVAHIPSDEELEELRAYEMSINTLNTSLQDTEKQKQKLLEERQRLDVSADLKGAVERAGGGEALVKEAQKHSNGARALCVSSIISAFLSGVLGGFSFLLSPFAVYMLSGAGALGALFIVLLLLFIVKKRKLTELCSAVGCKGTDELEAAVQRYESIKVRLQVNEENIAACEQRYAEYKALVEAEKSRLHEFLLDMDIQNGKGDIAVREIYDTLKERQRKSAVLEAEADKALAYYEGLLSKTEHLDADKLIEELGRLGVEDPFDCDLEKTERNISFYREQSVLLSDKIHAQELSLAELRARHTSPAEIRERIAECKAELESSEKKLKAYVLARDSLILAAEELRRGVAPALAKAAGKYMSTLTGGKYGELLLDNSFALSYEAHGESRHIEYMSCGTQELAYLCLRFALADIISKEGALPIILDEATAHLDNDRARGLLDLMCERANEGSQHILFTCHGREAALLSDESKEYNYVKL